MSTTTTNAQPFPASEAVAFRAQLKRLLAHDLFAHSKRYPRLLAYTVEKTLEGHASELKERTIGIEAFGRPADYDANADPVVRITAAEVRKRLIQYYYDPSHAQEPIIELPVGSYVPLFHLQDAPQAEAFIELTQASAIATQPELPPPPAPPAKRNWAVILVGALLIFAAGIAAGSFHFRAKPTSLERFWSEFAQSPAAITYCIGDPMATAGVAPSALDQALHRRLVNAGHLDLSDVVALAHALGPLSQRQGAFRVLTAQETSFTQLREGPFVLIGAFDNAWTLRLTEHLRYGFETSNGNARLVDRKNPVSGGWTTGWDTPYQQLTNDFAIIARFRDSMTGQPVVVIAGISDAATEAASEVLYNPAYLDALLAKAPKDWEQKNLEAVIETHLIEGHAGPPQVLAVESW